MPKLPSFESEHHLSSFASHPPPPHAADTSMNALFLIIRHHFCRSTTAHFAILARSLCATVHLLHPSPISSYFILVSVIFFSVLLSSYIITIQLERKQRLKFCSYFASMNCDDAEARNEERATE